MKDWSNHLDDAQRQLNAELAAPTATDASLFCEWIVSAFEGQCSVASAKIVKMALAGDFGVELRNKMAALQDAEVKARATSAETDALEAA